MGVAPLPPLRWKVRAGAVAAVLLLRDMLSRPLTRAAAALMVRVSALLEPRTALLLTVKVPAESKVCHACH